MFCRRCVYRDLFHRGCHKPVFIGIYSIGALFFGDLFYEDLYYRDLFYKNISWIFWRNSKTSFFVRFEDIIYTGRCPTPLAGQAAGAGRGHNLLGPGRADSQGRLEGPGLRADRGSWRDTQAPEMRAGSWLGGGLAR